MSKSVGDHGNPQLLENKVKNIITGGWARVSQALPNVLNDSRSLIFCQNYRSAVCLWRGHEPFPLEFDAALVSRKESTKLVV